MRKLIVKNLNEFFESDFENQFEILFQLEKNIKKFKKIKINITIESISFDLVEIKNIKTNTIFIYKYSKGILENEINNDNSIKNEIIELYNSNPRINKNKLAFSAGVSRQTIYNWINEIK